VAPVSAEAAISELPLSSKSRRLTPFLCSGPTLGGVSLERSFSMHTSCCVHGRNSQRPPNKIVLTDWVVAELDRGPMSALGQKRTHAAQQAMSALPPIATAKADIRKRSCLLCPRKRTCAVQ